ncbi:WSC domain containing protein [Beauveria brongniartii RCEF 3172]|uniref:WSC domain containing protein n=1 Tax=Beauveria brongniartii RCEF 3172 TaxID=1081107 RepID=A0A162K2Q1_9HYPO|nr:WSC domain containing protein [Beauveria brongniartii RCEF 3172]
MQMSLILALGVGKAVMAVHLVGNGTAPAKYAVTMPETVGEFSLVGCAGDEADFAHYKKVAKSEHMSLNLCAASCPSKYFATHKDECYCADDDAHSRLTQSPREHCVLPCPGNDHEACGGDHGKLCSVYSRKDKPKYETKIETHVHTVTACPSTVVHCPSDPHVTTQTKTVTTEICPAPEWHKKKIVCYGPHCAPEYPCKGDDCHKDRVVCRGDHCWIEPCRPGDDWSKLVIHKGGDDCDYATGCLDGDCHKKIVCYDGKCVIEHCVGDECYKNLICDGADCHYARCDSDKCHQKLNCPHGKDCTVVVPCDGDLCPKPSPFKPSDPAITAAPGGNNGGDYGNYNGNNGNYYGKDGNKGEYNANKGDDPGKYGNNNNKGDYNADKGDYNANKGDYHGKDGNKGDDPGKYGNNNGDYNGNNGGNYGTKTGDYNGNHGGNYGGNNGGNNGNNYGGNNGNNYGNNNGNNYGNNAGYGKPAPGGTASGTGVPRPTLPPMVGGAERNGVTFVGALAGLALLL